MMPSFYTLEEPTNETHAVLAFALCGDIANMADQMIRVPALLGAMMKVFSVSSQSHTFNAVLRHLVDHVWPELVDEFPCISPVLQTDVRHTVVTSALFRVLICRMIDNILYEFHRQISSGSPLDHVIESIPRVFSQTDRGLALFIGARLGRVFFSCNVPKPHTDDELLDISTSLAVLLLGPKNTAPNNVLWLNDTIKRLRMVRTPKTRMECGLDGMQETRFRAFLTMQTMFDFLTSVLFGNNTSDDYWFKPTGSRLLRNIDMWIAIENKAFTVDILPDLTDHVVRAEYVDKHFREYAVSQNLSGFSSSGKNGKSKKLTIPPQGYPFRMRARCITAPTLISFGELLNITLNHQCQVRGFSPILQGVIREHNSSMEIVATLLYFTMAGGYKHVGPRVGVHGIFMLYTMLISHPIVSGPSRKPRYCPIPPTRDMMASITRKSAFKAREPIYKMLSRFGHGFNGSLHMDRFRYFCLMSLQYLVYGAIREFLMDAILSFPYLHSVHTVIGRWKMFEESTVSICEKARLDFLRTGSLQVAEIELAMGLSNERKNLAKLRRETFVDECLEIIKKLHLSHIPRLHPKELTDGIALDTLHRAKMIESIPREDEPQFHYLLKYCAKTPITLEQIMIMDFYTLAVEGVYDFGLTMNQRMVACDEWIEAGSYIFAAVRTVLPPPMQTVLSDIRSGKYLHKDVLTLCTQLETPGARLWKVCSDLLDTVLAPFSMSHANKILLRCAVLYIHYAHVAKYVLSGQALPPGISESVMMEFNYQTTCDALHNALESSGSMIEMCHNFVHKRIPLHVLHRMMELSAHCRAKMESLQANEIFASENRLVNQTLNIAIAAEMTHRAKTVLVEHEEHLLHIILEISETSTTDVFTFGRLFTPYTGIDWDILNDLAEFYRDYMSSTVITNLSRYLARLYDEKFSQFILLKFAIERLSQKRLLDTFPLCQEEAVSTLKSLCKYTPHVFSRHTVTGPAFSVCTKCTTAAAKFACPPHNLTQYHTSLLQQKGKPTKKCAVDKFGRAIKRVKVSDRPQKRTTAAVLSHNPEKCIIGCKNTVLHRGQPRSVTRSKTVMSNPDTMPWDLKARQLNIYLEKASEPLTTVCFDHGVSQIMLTGRAYYQADKDRVFRQCSKCTDVYEYASCKCDDNGPCCLLCDKLYAVDELVPQCGICGGPCSERVLPSYMNTCAREDMDPNGLETSRIVIVNDEKPGFKCELVELCFGCKLRVHNSILRHCANLHFVPTIFKSTIPWRFTGISEKSSALIVNAEQRMFEKYYGISPKRRR